MCCRGKVNASNGKLVTKNCNSVTSIFVINSNFNFDHSFRKKSQSNITRGFLLEYEFSHFLKDVVNVTSAKSWFRFPS